MTETETFEYQSYYRTVIFQPIFYPFSCIKLFDFLSTKGNSGETNAHHSLSWSRIHTLETRERFHWQERFFVIKLCHWRAAYCHNMWYSVIICIAVGDAQTREVGATFSTQSTISRSNITLEFKSIYWHYGWKKQQTRSILYLTS